MMMILNLETSLNCLCKTTNKEITNSEGHWIGQVGDQNLAEAKI